jgi:FAD/FMN-containing dehydrogenase
MLLRGEPVVAEAWRRVGVVNPALVALARHVKAAFDPRGILNPGKLTSAA